MKLQAPGSILVAVLLLATSTAMFSQSTSPALSDTYARDPKQPIDCDYTKAMARYTTDPTSTTTKPAPSSTPPTRPLLLSGLLDKAGPIAEHAMVVDAHLGTGTSSSSATTPSTAAKLSAATPSSSTQS